MTLQGDGGVWPTLNNVRDYTRSYFVVACQERQWKIPDLGTTSFQQLNL